MKFSKPKWQSHCGPGSMFEFGMLHGAGVHFPWATDPFHSILPKKNALHWQSGPAFRLEFTIVQGAGSHFPSILELLPWFDPKPRLSNLKADLWERRTCPLYPFLQRQPGPGTLFTCLPKQATGLHSPLGLDPLHLISPKYFGKHLQRRPGFMLELATSQGAASQVPEATFLLHEIFPWKPGWHLHLRPFLTEFRILHSAGMQL